MTGRRTIQATVVAALGLALASCAAVGDGPLKGSEWGGLTCAPVALYPHPAFGIPLPGDLDETIAILAVEPIGGHGIEVGSLHLMPVEPALRTAFVEFPPTESFPDAWAHAVPAAGAEVRPGQLVDVVVELRPDPRGGSFEGLHVLYTAHGRVHDTTYGMRLDLAESCD